jgi:hypothetical protein
MIKLTYFVPAESQEQAERFIGERLRCGLPITYYEKPVEKSMFLHYLPCFEVSLIIPGAYSDQP